MVRPGLGSHERIDATAYRGKRVRIRVQLALDAMYFRAEVLSIIGDVRVPSGKEIVKRGTTSVELVADIRPDADAFELIFAGQQGAARITSSSLDLVP